MGDDQWVPPGAQKPATGNDEAGTKGPLRLSINKEPIWGLKVQKTLNLKDIKTAVTLGGIADLKDKVINGFAKLEVDCGKVGTLVADTEGVELQKHHDLPWGQLECRFSLGAGVGFNGKPYINFDLAPVRRPAKFLGGVFTVAGGEGMNVRPTLPLHKNFTVEAPMSIYRGDEDELNVQVHGALAGVWLPPSDFEFYGPAEADKDYAGGRKKRA